MLGVAAFYFISVGLITLGFATDVIDEGLQFPFIVVWAVAGLGLSVFAISRQE